MEKEKGKLIVSGRTNREVVILSKRDQMAQDITFVKARINHQEHFPLCPPTIVLLAPVVEPEDFLTSCIFTCCC